MSRFAGVLTAVTAAVAVLLGGSFGSAAGAQTDPAGASRAEAAASWLADQLVDGERLEVTFGTDSFDDPGLTIDAVLAFASAGVAEGFAADATAWLASSATTASYVGDGTVESYAGALAKLSLLAQVRGLDPTGWGQGDVDLVARLVSQEQVNGRFTDVSAYGDFSNSIGQSLAIVVLTREPGTAASDASIDLLLLSQCADGGFALELEPAGCESGVDTSAYALQALVAAGRPSDGGEVDRVVAYLEDVQSDDGGFGTAAGESSNANSTGLAVQALRVASRSDPADLGVGFLASLQVDCDASTDRGAVAFDASGFDAGTATRATAQALLGLAGVGYLDLSAATASSELPRFDCPALSSTTSSSTTSSTAPPPTTPLAVVSSASQTPAATPVIANPSFTG